jgi:hypothetical protein
MRESNHAKLAKTVLYVLRLWKDITCKALMLKLAKHSVSNNYPATILVL